MLNNLYFKLLFKFGFVVVIMFVYWLWLFGIIWYGIGFIVQEVGYENWYDWVG